MRIELIIAIIGAVVALTGYLVNSYFDRQEKTFELKSVAYADFLEQVEMLLPASSTTTLQDNEKIAQLNKTLTVLTTYAPNDVVRKMNLHGLTPMVSSVPKQVLSRIFFSLFFNITLNNVFVDSNG